MYYVYELVDPRDGKTFYVGKGSGGRIHQHERESRLEDPSPKGKHIRAIEDAGLNVQKNYLGWFILESEAYAAEKKLIELHGIENLDNLGHRLPQGEPPRRLRTQVDAEKRRSHNNVTVTVRIPLSLIPALDALRGEKTRHKWVTDFMLKTLEDGEPQQGGGGCQQWG